MDWIGIQLRVAIDRPEEANRVILAIGDALAGATGTMGRPWFMTSEHIGGNVGSALEATLQSLRSSRRHPAPQRPVQKPGRGINPRPSPS